MMYKRDIGNKIYKQMLQHFYCENGFLQEEVVGTRDYNLQQSYSCAERVNLFSDNYTGNIQSVLFEGVKRGVFSAAKFDSRPELVLARVLETDTDVQNWLRPAPQEFNITYNHGHNYEPDFVVETDDTIYLVEVKGEDKLSDPDVIAKKKRGIQYCEVASRWGKANGYKQWKYLFIPSKQIMPNSSFMQLAKCFKPCKRGQFVLAIEMAGSGFHEAGSKQAERDMKKNSVLEKCAVPFLRLRTDGSGEKKNPDCTKGRMIMPRIIRNAIRCKKCGDVIESKTVHDFKFCSCGSCAVDGGHDYFRRCGNCEDWEELSEAEK